MYEKSEPPQVKKIKNCAVHTLLYIMLICNMLCTHMCGLAPLHCMYVESSLASQPRIAHARAEGGGGRERDVLSLPPPPSARACAIREKYGWLARLHRKLYTCLISLQSQES